MAKRLSRLRWSTCSTSAIISRAARKAVSPEVIGAATTPSSARMPPTTPSMPFERVFTTHAGSCPGSAVTAANPSAPPKKAIAAAAQISAIIDSLIMAP